MEQTNANRNDALVAKESRCVAHRLFIERPQFLSKKIQPATHFAYVAQWYDALRLHPEIRISVALRHSLSGDLENMAKALGDDQAKAGDLALQERVGRDGRAVRKAGKIVKRCVTENRFDAVHQSDRRVRGRARNLCYAHRAGRGIHAHDVGKSTTGVDADAQIWAFPDHR
jgi:hypothetical protein